MSCIGVAAGPQMDICAITEYEYHWIIFYFGIMKKKMFNLIIKPFMSTYNVEVSFRRMKSQPFET